MEAHVFLAVLAAALCHALWNAALKVRIDPGIAITMIAVASGIAAAPAAPFVGLPASQSWPYLFTSLIIHVFYYVWLAEAYRSGDLGQVYPIARGSAPVMTALGSALIFGEVLGAMRWAGILLLTSGVLLLSFRGGRIGAAGNGRAVGFALATACVICAYTLVDGRGARLSENPHGYAVWLFVLDGALMAAVGAVRQRAQICEALAVSWLFMLGGGALSVVSYWIAIWAMSLAPIGLVAAVRETSVLFAAALGFFLLREPMTGARIAAAVLVVAGLVLIRVG